MHEEAELMELEAAEGTEEAAEEPLTEETLGPYFEALQSCDVSIGNALALAQLCLDLRKRKRLDVATLDMLHERIVRLQADYDSVEPAVLKGRSEFAELVDIITQVKGLLPGYIKEFGEWIATSKQSKDMKEAMPEVPAALLEVHESLSALSKQYSQNPAYQLYRHMAQDQTQKAGGREKWTDHSGIYTKSRPDSTIATNAA